MDEAAEVVGAVCVREVYGEAEGERGEYGIYLSIYLNLYVHLYPNNHSTPFFFLAFSVPVRPFRMRAKGGDNTRKPKQTDGPYDIRWTLAGAANGWLEVSTLPA